MAEKEGSTPGSGGGPKQDDLDPSILEAVGRANEELKAAAESTPGGSEASAASGAAARVQSRAAGNAGGSGAAGAEAGGTMDQDSIDDLLNAAAFEDPQEVSASAATDEPMLASDDFSSGGAASSKTGNGSGAASTATASVAKFDLPSLGSNSTDGPLSPIDLLRDVELNVKIELGRSRMLVEDVLKLAEGSVVELDKLAGDPVDVFVNDRLVARGEVLVLNDNFCVRVNEIVAALRDDGL